MYREDILDTTVKAKSLALEMDPAKPLDIRLSSNPTIE